MTVLTEKVKSIDDLKDVLEATDKAALDAKQVIELINRRVFQRNSDATRFLNNEIDPCCPLLEELGLADVVKHVLAVTGEKGREAERPRSPKGDKRSQGLIFRRAKAPSLSPLLPRLSLRLLAVAEFIRQRYWSKWELTQATYQRVLS